MLPLERPHPLLVTGLFCAVRKDPSQVDASFAYFPLLLIELAALHNVPISVFCFLLAPSGRVIPLPFFTVGEDAAPARQLNFFLPRGLSFSNKLPV